MKSRSESLIRLKKFQVDEKRRQVLKSAAPKSAEPGSTSR